MIKSMTGYGKTEFEVNNKKISIEIKSLNSKQLDINSRIPVMLRGKEFNLRKTISGKLIRGKIDFNFFIESIGTESSSAINEGAVLNYYNQLSEIQRKLGIPVTGETISTIMRFPDSIKTETKELDDEEYKKITDHLEEVLESVDQFRIQEGKALDKDIRSHIIQIQKLQKDIAPFESQRIETIKENLLANLNKSGIKDKIDKDRFDQEIVFYLDKLDINEEKVRLANHCLYFLKTLDENSTAGKKLGFISQEIGREINTLGSKANDSNIQHIVVQMKDALEKVKEQMLNVL